MQDKVVASMDEAVAEIPDGATVMIGGFGPGIPYNLISALHRRGTKDLTVIGINATRVRRPDIGMLEREGRIRRLITQAGDGDGPSLPQGTLAERIRAGAAGIPAFYTPTSVGTLIAEGKEHRDFGGRTYVLETALTADYALIPARRADRFGNLQFEYTQRTINPVMARAAKKTFVEANEVVETGALDPNFIHCPGIFVDKVAQVPPEPEGFYPRPFNIEGVPTRDRLSTHGLGGEAPAETDGKRKLAREEILLRAIQDFQPGWLVNLGSGLPSYIANLCPPERDVVFHAENGLIGMGRMAAREELNVNLANALAQHVLLVPGAAIMDHAESFGMVRSGRLDVTVLGAYQVAQNRDFANVSRTPGKPGAGGGAMDMARNAKRVFVVMEHVTAEGGPKLLRRCTLPLTAPGVVTRTYTDLGVFEFGDDAFVLKEIAPGWTLDEVRSLSDAEVLAAPDLKEIDVAGFRAP